MPENAVCEYLETVFNKVVDLGNVITADYTRIEHKHQQKYQENKDYLRSKKLLFSGKNQPISISLDLTP